jgi:cellulose synthase/poly-beta-1,6-N-acetylglucosamine synthase-like glycosyltransferase
MALPILILFFLTLNILYWIFLLLGVSRKRENKVKTRVESLPPAISVVVCAHDEEENLRQLIPKLLRQNYSAYEIIIVEDRSNDGTFDLLLDLTKQYSNLKMVRVVAKPDHIHGKKFAITLGIKAAKHEWILLTDADCKPHENWISQMATQMTQTNQIVLGYSPYIRRKGVLNSFIRFETQLTAIQMFGFAHLGRPYMGIGRNLAYRKSLFLDTKGFNNYLEVIGGDDDLFVNQHGGYVQVGTVLHPDASVYSIPKSSRNDYLTQKTRHLSVGKFYRTVDQVNIGVFAVSAILGLLLGFYSLFTDYWLWGLILLFFRWTLMNWTFYDLGKRTGEIAELWKIPLLDFIYAFYYLVTGLRALTAKKVRWKN